MRVNTRLSGVLLFLIAGLALAEPTRKVVYATRTPEPPRLDGAVTESQWHTAQPVLDFTQGEPVEGARPSELTSVRMLYDDRALYVGVICYDSDPRGIVRQLSRRDRTTEADRFTILLDSYFDRQSAFVFATNVSGVQTDGILSQEGKVYDVTWDAVWDVKTRVYLDGWSAEFEIPFNALRFAESPGEDYVWGVNFRRYISRKNETVDWVMVPRTDPYEISKWGTLEGIRAITPPLHLVLSPYVAGSSTIQTAVGSEPRRTTNTYRAGMDVKYGLARNFTIDATINPDFGQVEVDQAVLNLTVFETRYPEKRPFFIEGSQFFTFGSSRDDTPLPLFFSRRIGRRPGGWVIPPPGGRVTDDPQQTTILGAAKLSGRSASGLSVGALTALTDEEHATVVDSLDRESSIRTEPWSSYSVLRLKQDFEGGSWFGGMATIVGTESLRPALSGGVDWNLHFAEGTHSLDGYIAGARGRYGERILDGAAGRLLVSRIAASPWSYIASYDFYSRHLMLNDLGFFARPHDHGGYAQLLYRILTPEAGFLRYGGSIVPESRWNWDGVLTMAQVEGSIFGTFENYWTTQLVVAQKLPAYDDAERGIIGTYRRPAATAVTAQVISDSRQGISGTLTGMFELDRRSGRQVIASLGLTIKATPSVEFTPSLLYLRERRKEAAAIAGGRVGSVDAGGVQQTIFGDREVDELDLGFGGIVTFTRDLTLQWASQILMARGNYENYRRLVTSTSFASSGLGPKEPLDAQYDFKQTTLYANVLLRWEFLPGSAAYLVWTQSRAGVADHFRESFALPHEDVVFLKVSYLLPF